MLFDSSWERVKRHTGAKADKVQVIKEHSITGCQWILGTLTSNAQYVREDVVWKGFTPFQHSYSTQNTLPANFPGHPDALPVFTRFQRMNILQKEQSETWKSRLNLTWTILFNGNHINDTFNFCLNSSCWHTPIGWNLFFDVGHEAAMIAAF